MSDLQCAARIIVVNPSGLGDVAWLASSLGRQKVAAVYAADDVPDTGRVESLAGGLGLPAQLGRGDLADGTSGFEEIVDRHRGETAVVVRTGGHVQPVLLLVDADGAVQRPLDGPE